MALVEQAFFFFVGYLSNLTQLNKQNLTLNIADELNKSVTLIISNHAAIPIF